MSIPCMICNSRTNHFMHKHFEQLGLGNVEYDRCPTCGFVFSHTHHEMSDAQWEDLNNRWVSQYQGTEENPEDPRWLERMDAQSLVIADMNTLGLLPKGCWLDYGAGDGKLAAKLLKEHHLTVENYEHSSNPAKGYLRAEELKPKDFSLVMHTAVVEHLRFRTQLDSIFNLVRDDGAMMLHTLVAENIPQDPNWFYFLSVHCSFFTNRAMQLLFEQYGYRCSLYNVASRMWVWFKQPIETIRPTIEKANSRGDVKLHYILADHFVDYWK